VEGINLNDEFKRLTLHSNLNSKVNDWLTIGLNTSYSYLDNSGLAASLYDARNATPLANNYIGSPYYDLYLCGELFQPYPLANLYVTNSDITNELNAIVSAKINIPWIKGLTNELNYSNRYYIYNSDTFYPVTTPQGVSNKGQAVKYPSESRDWVVNDIVSYVRAFGDHSVNGTLLFSNEGRKGSWSQMVSRGFDNESLGYNNLGLATNSEVTSGAYEESTISYMARANYSYKSRYMITGTVRRDGYSGFGAGNKWATFPSVSLAWVASEESFLKDADIYLKLRTSYGVNGNQGIGRYSSLSRMSTSYYVYGQSTAIGLYPSNIGNENLGWESTTSFNIGLDYGFLNQRISGSVDVYKAKTENVLVQRSLPMSSGYTEIWTNIGGIDNKGIEVELRTLNLDGRVRWESSFMFAMNKDKISKLYGGENDQDIGNSWFVGEPISAIYDYEMSGGVWQEEDLFSRKTYEGWYPGQFKYVDQNSDGEIEPVNDRTIVGYSAPLYRFSINNTISYSNFTFSFFINSIQGGSNHYIENNAENISPLFYMDNRRNNSAINPYWRPDAPTNNTTGIFNVPPVYGGIYQSRSFVRLQDVSLTYRLGPDILKKIKLKSCQIYIASKNPYVWTKWQGWDPETGTSDTPMMRNIIAGLKVSF
jgi:TonB-linked SusC/RagA family outer membrane protein